MKKLIWFLSMVLISVLLIACSSDDNNNQNNSEGDAVANEENNGNDVNGNDNEGNTIDERNDSNENNVEDDATDEDSEETNTKEGDTEELSEADKQEILDEYPDAFRIGDTAHFERSDGISNEDLEFKINSFKMVDEIEGTEPKNDAFLLVNLTVKDLLEIEEDITMEFIRVNVRDSEDDIFRKEEDELFQEFEEGEPYVYTGDLVFDVKESNYYRVSIYDLEFLIFKDEVSESE
ncbi:MAG TPA: hypothetical protein VK142_02610 [Bacillota bacterium]|nr:hypothetical protein [Bacillota bacterium]